MLTPSSVQPSAPRRTWIWNRRPSTPRPTAAQSSASASSTARVMSGRLVAPAVVLLGEGVAEPLDVHVERDDGLARGALAGEREREMPRLDGVVAVLGRLVERQRDRVLGRVAEAHPAPARAVGLRVGGRDLAAQLLRLDGACDARIGVDEREQEVRRLDRGMRELAGEPRGEAHRLLGLRREAAERAAAVAAARADVALVAAPSVRAAPTPAALRPRGRRLAVVRTHDLVDALMAEQERVGDLPHVPAAGVQEADRVVVVGAQVLELALTGEQLLAELLR